MARTYIIAVLLICCMIAGMAQAFSGLGSGIVQAPYRVATAAQFAEVNDYLDKHFIQTADIAGVTAGIADTFSGSYNGQGYGIDVAISTDVAAYLFENVSGTLQRITVTGTMYSSGDAVAGIAITSSGSIENCKVYADLSTEGTGSNVAGISLLGDGTTTDCLAIGNFESTDGIVYGVSQDNVVVSSYYDKTFVPDAADNGRGLTTAQLKSGTLPSGFDPNFWYAVAGSYPALWTPENADINGDDWVDFKDFALVAANWQKTSGISPVEADIHRDGVVDWRDIAVIADQWLTGTPPSTPPIAGNVSATVTQYLLNRIALVGTDDGNPRPPGKLSYIITSLPADGQLYDIAPGGMEITQARLPYTVLVNTPYVSYYSTAMTPSPVTFGYKVNDYGTYPYGGDSGTATATLTKAAYVKDNLSFDGGGYVTVADNAAMDGDTFAASFWLRTTRPDGGILAKRVPGGSGIELSLWAGLPAIRFYDANGMGVTEAVRTAYGAYRIDDGQWHVVTVVAQSGNIYLAIDADTAAWLTVDTAGCTMNNSADLYIGTDGRRNWSGSLDRLCYWKNPAGAWWDIAQINVVARTATTYGFAPTPTLDWQFSEAAGATVTDSRLGLAGTFSDPNHVTWIPQGQPLLNIVPWRLP